jgi:hypothetical protein
MYKLYQYKSIKCGFIVLCSSSNIGQLKSTTNSIKAYYPNSEITVVEGSSSTSMINKGLKESKCNEWNFIIPAGGWIKSRIDIKYSYFIESNKDILFPVLKTRSINYNFMSHDNGMMIHKEAFTDIGEFPDGNDSKLIWATTAIEKGYKFKGVIGGRFF